ncbi:helix-turn-helix domain-containing protein [Clostridium beijerinckii]|uniref:helix-turn-helix domain-containing protein n=1 Tax=Clostridium beijerinckii TaxID=1520 RepID=UPI0003D32C36|nr:helix-turn-helix transcriptional regulator [Clostridium beijerinckii]ALB48724.2 XRE family transcriptional regulator [Clostridium beijerinckii NRRL B-598]
MEIINERIKSIRIALKMKQNDFAKELTISQGHLSDIENGRKDVTNKIQEIIILKFNVNEEWLRNGIDPMFVEPDTFSLDSYLKQRGMTEEELDIIKGVFEIPVEFRMQAIGYFKTKILPKLRLNDETSSTKEETMQSNIDEEVAAFREELEAELKGETLSVSEKQEGA